MCGGVTHKPTRGYCDSVIACFAENSFVNAKLSLFDRQKATGTSSSYRFNRSKEFNSKS